MLNKLKVRNFGPIKNGSLENEGWIELNKVTLFIGNQGSGKSTLAKLISTLTWIEKALVRGDFSEKSLTDKVLKKHFTYQNISSYFKDETIIEYKGKAFYISYKHNLVKVKKNEQNGYSFPKIMYVPSERNFVSSVRNIRTLKGLPSTLYTFSDEFINAIEELKGEIELPINNTKFEYQKLNKLPSIIGNDFKIKLSEASSGFQSFVPLYIVSNFLANSLENKNDITTKDISIEEGKRIRKEIEHILSNPNISDDVKQASLEFLSSKFKYSSFINIVEEPEQNLFPNSQNKILNSLLKFNNLDKNNSLIITTHSPYILNYLCVSIQAKYVYEKIKNLPYQKLEFTQKLSQIVPLKSMISSIDVAIYQLNEITGTIEKLKDYEGIPSDNNYLNKSLEEASEMFDSLLEIEQEL